MYRGLKVVVIAPCYNEEKKIPLVVERVRNASVADHMVVVDDGSTDTSAEVAKKAGAEVLRLPSRRGVGAAIRAGLTYAKTHGDVAVILAGNNKDEPNEISRLLDPIADERAVFVQGSRFARGGHAGGAMPIYRHIATRVHPLIFSLCTGKYVTESTNGFRALRIDLLADSRIELDQRWLDGYELEPYLYYKVVTLGHRTAEVPVTKLYPPRKESYTKMRPLIDWWNILRPLFLLRLGLRR